MGPGWARAVISLGLGLALAAAGASATVGQQPPSHPHVIGQPSAAGQSGRTPVPDAEAQKQALALLDEVYGADRKAADTTDDKTQLAKRLLEQATQTRGKAADQFVLMQVAGELAAAAGDAQTAIEAAEMMAGRFDVNRFDAMARALSDVAAAAKFTAQNKLLAETAVGLMDEAIAADEFDSSARLAAIALKAAQDAREGILAQQIAARQEQIDQRKAAYAPVAEALAVLAVKPVDPAANSTVGCYRCLWKDDWERGIAMLALGNDADTSGLAIRELEGPSSAAEIAALGDGWWDLGETQEGRPRMAYLLRAGYWYKQALPELAAGLTKMKIEKRLEDVNRLEEEAEASAPEAGKESEEPEWEPVRDDGMLTRCYTLGPFVQDSPDPSIIRFISVGFTHKTNPDREYMGRKLIATEGVMMRGSTPWFVGPSQPGAKMYYAFCVRSDRNQRVEFTVDAAGIKDNNRVAVVVDGVPIRSNSGVLPLKRGIHVMIVEQTHIKGDAPDQTWVTAKMRGQPPLEQRR